MKNYHRITLSGMMALTMTCALLTLHITAGHAAAQEQEAEPQRPPSPPKNGGLSTESSTSDRCYNFGNTSAANYLKFCISRHGNITELYAGPSPSRNVMKSEGYAVCARGNSAVASDSGYDAMFSEAGFGPGTITPSNPTQLPVTIKRATGCLTLTQVINRDANESEIVITMTVKNNCGVNIPDVRLVRYFDADLYGDMYYDFAGQTYDTAWIQDMHVQMLTAFAPGIDGHYTSVMKLADANYTLCEQFGAISPTAATEDWAGRVFYYLGTLGGTASKTYKLIYRVQ
jgi:hypothetical protein